LYIYLHIPKAAGTALRSVLKAAYGPDAIFWGYEAKSVADLAQEILSLSAGEIDALALIASHHQFGLHTLLASEHRYVTMLRDPIDRFVSDFYFIQGDDGRPRHRVLEGREGISITDYIQSGLSTIDNGLVRLISGTCDGRPHGLVTADDLEIAKQNLRHHFAAVGFSDSFAESVILFRRKLGWPRAPFYRRENVTKHRLAVADIPSADLNIINRYFELDRELYDYARGLYESDIHSLGTDFSSEVHEYNVAIRDVHRILDDERSQLLAQRASSEHVLAELRQVLETRSHRAASRLGQALSTVKGLWKRNDAGEP